MSAALSAASPVVPASADAYRRCEQITREHAANFYYGIRLLSHPKRDAMCAVYAFARRIDDIGDGAMQPDRKLALLDEAEHALGELEGARSPDSGSRQPATVQNSGSGSGQPATAQNSGSGSGQPATAQNSDSGSGRSATAQGDPVLIALADAHARFALPLDALRDLIEGVRMDVRGATYERFEELIPYCRRVAGSIGRLCVAIFGAREEQRARRLADDLGVAMQLTNILRDVREDAANGRVYLPAEDLVRYQLSADGRYEGEEGQFEAFMRFQAARAQEWFSGAMELVPLLDRRSAACVLAMSGIYRRVLERIEAHPELTTRERVSLPVWEKGWVALRSLLGAVR